MVHDLAAAGRPVPEACVLAEAAFPGLGPRGAERVKEMADFLRFLERRMPELLQEWTALQAPRQP